MTNKPNHTPSYFCPTCARLMCPDCLSLSGEFSFLLHGRSLELMEAHQEIERLKRDLAFEKEEGEAWRRFALMPFPEAMKLWMESEVWKQACKPPKSEQTKRLNRLIKQTRELLSKPYEPPK